MKMRDYMYIADLSSLGGFDDWYNAVIRDQTFNGKAFDDLDEEQQLWVCYWFDKDYLQRD